MFSLYSKSKFDAYIFKVEDDIAYVQVVDDDGEKSYMEIPSEVLEGDNIKFKTGVIFHITHKRLGKWEKIEMFPSKKAVVTQREVDKILEGYREKYKDV